MKFPNVDLRPIQSLWLVAIAITLMFVITADAICEESQFDATLPRMRSLVDRFALDQASYDRADMVPPSSERWSRRRSFLINWQHQLDSVRFDSLPQDGKIDFVLFRNYLRHELRQVDFDAVRRDELGELADYDLVLIPLLESQRRMEPVHGRHVAAELAKCAEEVERTADRFGRGEIEVQEPIAQRVLLHSNRMRRAMEQWHEFYAGYDPNFTWWTTQPFAQLMTAMQVYREKIENHVSGAKPADQQGDVIVGDPIGREALMDELRYEMIPYTPEELIGIAEREFAWCDRELKRAAHDMGMGDDWRSAIETVKSDHVEPGAQPELIRHQANEIVQFLESRQLVTIPAECRDSWRMEMMSPDRQRVNPYFTGGDVISISFPTDGMSHIEKGMSLRSNNVHFCRATVHHELIPGHHLQMFMADRFRAHRQLFRTPFLVEGWALYWEMLLWDLDFAQSPENRLGMLFWRTHRCARIILSLGFHLGQRQPQEMVEFLVARVGHERSAAEAEVRRWVAGEYGPLYQAAYMLGGLQIRSLHQSLVESGKMKARDFHDAILRENSIPIDMIRVSLTNAPISADYESAWRFYDR